MKYNQFLREIEHSNLSKRGKEVIISYLEDIVPSISDTSREIYFLKKEVCNYLFRALDESMREIAINLKRDSMDLIDTPDLYHGPSRLRERVAQELDGLASVIESTIKPKTNKR